MQSKMLRMFVKKVGFFASLTILLIYSISSNSEVRKMTNTTIQPTKGSDSIVHVVGLSGEVNFSDSPLRNGDKLNGEGILNATGKSSWVDIEYLSGDRLRLKNGSIEISFGDQLTSNIGIDFGMGSSGHNTRRIVLHSGKLFTYIKEFEQLRKLQYYFSTNIMKLKVTHGAFVIEKENEVSRVSICKGSVMVEPLFTLMGGNSPITEVKLSKGSSVSVKEKESLMPTPLLKPDMNMIVNEFNSMGISVCE